MINNSGTYQNCTILEHTRIEVVKYKMTGISICMLSLQSVLDKTITSQNKQKQKILVIRTYLARVNSKYGYKCDYN